MTIWPRVPLGEVLQEQKVRVGSFDADGLSLLGVSNSEGLHRSDKLRIADMSRYLRVEHRWFAYNPMRINVGSIGWAEHPKLTGIISPDYVVFSCREQVEPKLVFLFLKSAVGLQAINFETAGSVRERLYFDSLARIQFPLAPLVEQRRVVARIEELAAQIHEARTLRQQATDEAEALGASWLNSAFAKLPQESHRHLDDVANIIGGGSLPDESLIEPGPIEVMFIKVSDMNRAGNETIVKNSASGTALSSSLLKGLRVVPPNAIVFPKRGGAIATNKKRILRFPAVLDPNMMAVFPKSDRQLASEFLFKWFTNLDLSSLQSGTSVPQINKGDLGPLMIPVPPLTEQRRIVAELDALQAEVDALKRLQAETAAELDALLPAILDRAFKGEL